MGKGYPAEFIKRTEERLKTAIAGLTQQIQSQTIQPEAVRQKSTDILKLVCNMGTIYRAAPLSEKKPLLRHIASDFVLDGHKIYPKYREPFNIFAEGNKKCLEIKGKSPKSSKHLIWGSNQLPVPHFYPNPVKKIPFSLRETGNISLYPKECLYLFCIRIQRE